jgi:hypothetical protein
MLHRPTQPTTKQATAVAKQAEQQQNLNGRPWCLFRIAAHMERMIINKYEIGLIQH